MGRILFFLILAFVGYSVFKSWQRKQLNSDGPSQPQGRVTHNPKEVMYACKHCGTHSPLAEGVMLEGRFYCNLDHAKRAGENTP